MKSNITTDQPISNQYLDKKLEQLAKQMLEYVDIRFKTVEERLDAIDIRHDKILTTLDWLVGAFKKFDEEHTVLTGRYADVRETLDDHESRIAVMEKKARYPKEK